MREQIEIIYKNSQLISEQTKERETITRNQAKILQLLLDEIQCTLDEISNDLQRGEQNDIL